ncbi:MAG: cytochrome-c peroxidase [Cryomorphaceae bacterium]|nr:cytochrome-c peroxidase [Cryomorphaceae bacterium]
MRKRILTTLAAVSIIFATAFACGEKEKTEVAPEKGKKKVIENTLTESDMEIVRQAKKFFKVLPEIAEADYEITDELVDLGKMLYFDTRLSKSNTISCNSCHNLATFGVDNNPTSIGHKWVAGPRNSPTVLNAALHGSQFWDGRAKDVEEQAEGPILNPIEMGSPHEEFVIDRLRTIDSYSDLFASAFPGTQEPLTYKNMARAIGAFERTLITPAPFDEYLSGRSEALTENQKKGLKTFMDVGCTTCHTGSVLGGDLFQKFGLIKGPYWEYTDSEKIDEGRYEVTGKDFDKYVFKVPGLRNITHTAPYFHDGSVWSLEKAIEIMGITQLGRELTEEEIESIADFLASLTGEVPEYARTLPILPKMGKETIHPDFD